MSKADKRENIIMVSRPVLGSSSVIDASKPDSERAFNL